MLQAGRRAIRSKAKEQGNAALRELASDKRRRTRSATRILESGQSI